MLPLHRKSNRFRNAKPTCQMLTQGATGARKYEFVIRHKFMLRLRLVERQSEAITSSTCCHFLCLISLHSTCVKSYTFSAAQMQVIIFDS